MLLFRSRAKLLLRKKKYQEQLLAQTDGQLENLERLVHDIEFAQIETQVLDGLRKGNESLKKVNAVLNIDEIEKILSETREGVDKQQVRALATNETIVHFTRRLGDQRHAERRPHAGRRRRSSRGTRRSRRRVLAVPARGGEVGRDAVVARRAERTVER